MRVDSRKHGKHSGYTSDVAVSDKDVYVVCVTDVSMLVVCVI